MLRQLSRYIIDSSISLRLTHKLQHVLVYNVGFDHHVMQRLLLRCKSAHNVADRKSQIGDSFRPISPLSAAE
ncbi:hypothetical protein D3C78_1123190 [compost metagenome]